MCMLLLTLGFGFHRHQSPDTHYTARDNWGDQLGSIVASLGTGPPDRVWDWLELAATVALAHAKATIKAPIKATVPLHAKAASEETASAAHCRHGQHACMNRCRQQIGSVRDGQHLNLALTRNGRTGQKGSKITV